MANQLIIDRALDSNGYIAPAAKATVYADGTTTLIDVYSDTSGTVAGANPIIADADGFWPQRFVTEAAKIVVTDAGNVTLYTMDPVPVAQGLTSAAAGVAFAPSVAVPQSNVQGAIDYVATLAASGFAPFGLGITGNATLLANIDATVTGAGIYRFDGTSTGTLPGGVAAGDTGMIELWRQAGATAMMELHHATTNRVFRRRLTTTVWGAWREEINVDQTTVEGDMIYRGASDFKRLAKGTATQVLRMHSGAAWPEWVTPTYFGVGQTWQDVSGSRVRATTYQNTTGKPIMVNAAVDGSAATLSRIEVSVDNSVWVVVAGSKTSNVFDNNWAFSVVVPDQHYYRVYGGDALHMWVELR